MHTPKSRNTQSKKSQRAKTAPPKKSQWHFRAELDDSMQRFSSWLPRPEVRPGRPSEGMHHCAREAVGIDAPAPLQGRSALTEKSQRHFRASPNRLRSRMQTKLPNAHSILMYSLGGHTLFSCTRMLYT